MNILTIAQSLIRAAGIALIFSGAAHAGNVLYDNSGLIVGQQSFEDAFVLSGPGTLTITLSDVAWPNTLASLDLVLSTSQGLVAPEMGPGTESFQVSGGDMFAQWFGTAQGPLDAGAFGVKIEFTPTPVPLPGSMLLLLSGLLLLAWLRCKGDLPVRA